MTTWWWGGTPFLPLLIGSDTRSASYLVSESTARKLVFRYAVQRSDGDNDGITWEGSIDLGPGGSIGDSLANPVTVMGLTVPSLRGVLVDGSFVTLTRITIASGWKKLGDVLSLIAHFGGDVMVTGSPHLTLDVGGTFVNADFAGTTGNLASSYLFTYTVGAGHNDSDGIEVTGVVLEEGERLDNPLGTPVVFLGPFTFSDVKVDTEVPAQPTLSLLTPSPNEDSTPDFLVGTVELLGGIIRLYKSSDCSGSVFVEQTVALDPQTLTAADLGTPPVTDNFSAKFLDLASNESLCSSSVSYAFRDEVIHRAVGAGGNSSCVLSTEGVVKCWGENNHGQLGQGHTNNLGDASGEMGGSIAAMDLGLGIKAKQIAVGGEHICALLSDGAVKCWGNGAHGQLGLGGYR